MPWWSWILIWVALSALALLFLVFCGFKLWRQVVALVRTFNQVTAERGAFWDKSLEKAAVEHVTEPRTAIPGSAVFATPEKMKDDYLAAKEERRFVRLQRRVARRKERGQLQSLRDIEAIQDVG
ncbi:hypothetical protein JOF48_003437 [Arthrobacter stackebrandtii]|uniref:Uncharacterized protein n=1 Tax=Arthrobacter stackebrandtii TaxID=272161 RepID=A0ABS4Z0T5_9MICC|nr:hypothetical protein [Arthrobacter stackebrandtii]MBP2414638.1 hypothetical protein [Arthrobacter stackebrandtii]PYH01734.1 hypothetical protein CVV67_04570 [Arthrobacter stackebrandtii]